MATIKDVAREANVGVMTASRVARNENGVSESTRKRVLEVMEKLGYKPDALAQALRTRKSNVIGIIVSDVENIFYMQVIAHIEQRLKAKGYSLLISFSSEDSEVEIESIEMMLRSRVGGIVITPVKRDDTKFTAVLKGHSIPVLQLYRNIYPEIDSLIVDDMYGTKVATRRLLEEGHRRILLLDVDWEGRAAGYKTAYHEMGLSVDERYIRTYSLNLYEESRIVDQIRHLKPTAILAGTNLLGYSAIAACRKLGLTIPKDVSLIIQDDISWISLMDITVISQPMQKIAQEAVNMMLERINADKGKNSKEQLSINQRIIRPSLIERASVASPND